MIGGDRATVTKADGTSRSVWGACGVSVAGGASVGRGACFLFALLLWIASGPFSNTAMAQEPEDLLPFLAQSVPPSESATAGPRPRQPPGQTLPLKPTR